MTRNTPISAGDHVTGSLDAPPAGRPGKKHDARVMALRSALIAGEQSGPPQPFNNKVFTARMRAKHNTRR